MNFKTSLPRNHHSFYLDPQLVEWKRFGEFVLVRFKIGIKTNSKSRTLHFNDYFGDYQKKLMIVHNM